MSPSNSITLWISLLDSRLRGSRQCARGSKHPQNLGSQEAAASPLLSGNVPPEPSLRFRASSPQPASPRAVSHPAPGIRRPGERVSAPRWFTSCRLWPWPCPVPYPRGWIWAGCGQAPRAPLPPTRGGTRRRFFKHLVVEYL